MGDQIAIDERCLGKISILTNLDWSAEKVYFVYKEREEVELAFDSMKNELENDKAYLGNDDAVRGYFFVSFLSLYLYFGVLSSVYLVKYRSGKERLSEVSSKVQKLMTKFGLDLLPKN
jgi:transposase